jgi:hypothetical protein
MVEVRLYVEGGGDTNSLKTACRQGFSEFLKKAGLAGHMPRIVACGSRQNAHDDFCTALQNGESAILLVDSEEPVNATQPPWQPWMHLQSRIGDKWTRPPNATDSQCHLMVECMEAWLLADKETLKTFFGQGFKENVLPNVANSVENISKQQIYSALATATKDCKTKAQYDKGEHSFKLLALIDPTKVIVASGWAKNFIDEMKKVMIQS